MYNIDGVNILQCFDNTLIISRPGSCQVLISVIWCYTLVSSPIRFLVQICLSGQCIQTTAYYQSQYLKGSQKEVT